MGLVSAAAFEVVKSPPCENSLFSLMNFNE